LVAREKSKKELIEAAVRSMARVTGCEAMMIVSEDGAILAHDAVKNIAKEGVLVASLGVFSHRLSMILGAGELDRILLGWERRRLILRDRPYYFEVHLKEGVRLEEVTPNLRKALSHLKGIEALPRSGKG
jgi:predicted regulator of Ras-like GTPase activity (Roadblock/LC7/MglB family)